MKTKILSLALIVFVCLQLINCNSDNDFDALVDPVSVTIPVIKSKSEIRNSIEISAARSTNSDGKIYVYEDLLFYIAQNSGIHIFNNENPENPINMSFIELEGVHDISIKNGILYADNFMDLVVFDISNLSSIQLVNIEEDMLSYYAGFPEDILYYHSGINPTNENEFIAEYITIDMERVEVENNTDIYDLNSEIFIDFLDTAIANNIGVGGSYAKFQILNDALYTIDDYMLYTYDITDYNSISLVSETWMEGWFGGELETTFILKDNLFIGATNGMHIVGLQDEFNPVYTSSFLHATGCDPVVAEESTAYITVRGGNTCGAIEDQINVIDISNISTPVEYSTYFLTNPYGLGVKDQVLFVCNDEGINVFDAQNPNNLVLENIYESNSKDVIPLSSHLITVGENMIQQYNYVGDFGLELVSTIQF
ncbi:LVIVD repeat-containing protein [Psychroserpens sp. MEBiC05023]